MANMRVSPEMKKNPIAITIPEWLNKKLTEKSQDESRAKSELVCSALIEAYKFERGE